MQIPWHYFNYWIGIAVLASWQYRSRESSPTSNEVRVASVLESQEPVFGSLSSPAEVFTDFRTNQLSNGGYFRIGDLNAGITRFRRVMPHVRGQLHLRRWQINTGAIRGPGKESGKPVSSKKASERQFWARAA
jgi:hypothetical protein